MQQIQTNSGRYQRVLIYPPTHEIFGVRVNKFLARLSYFGVKGHLTSTDRGDQVEIIFDLKKPRHRDALESYTWFQKGLEKVLSSIVRKPSPDAVKEKSVENGNPTAGNSNFRVICLEPPVKEVKPYGYDTPVKIQTQTEPLVKLFRFYKVMEEPLKRETKDGAVNLRPLTEGETPDLLRFTLDMSDGLQEAVYKIYSRGHSSSLKILKFNNPTTISIQLLRDFSTIYLEDKDLIYVILNTNGMDDHQVYMIAMGGEFRFFEVSAKSKIVRMLTKLGYITQENEMCDGKTTVRMNIGHDDGYAMYHTLLFQDGVKQIIEDVSSEAEVIL